jgi:DNA-binding NarL/FixJ family response regulator
MNIEQALPNAPAFAGSRTGGSSSNHSLARVHRRIHVLLADQKGMIRDALCSLVGSMPDVTLVSSATSGPEALRSAANLRPDVVIIEFPKPPNAGASLIAELKRQRPELRVIVLTIHRDEQLLETALRAGADAYVLKQDTSDELSNALASVLAGKTHVSSSMAGRATRGSRRGGADSTAKTAAGITPRERQVIRLIAQGHRTREIAVLLSLSHKTVEKHRTSIMRKIGVRNASAVAAYAMAHGFADD